MVTEIRQVVSMFGDRVDVAIGLDGGHVVSLRAIRGAERAMRLAAMVGKQLAGGRPLLEQHWNLVALHDLMAVLFEVEDSRRVAAEAAEQDRRAAERGAAA